MRPVTRPMAPEPVLHYGQMLGLGELHGHPSLAQEFAAPAAGPELDPEPAERERPTWTGGFSPAAIAAVAALLLALVGGAWWVLFGRSESATPSSARFFLSAVNAAASGDCATALADLRRSGGVLEASTPPLGSGREVDAAIQRLRDMSASFALVGSSGPAEIRADFATAARGMSTLAGLAAARDGSSLDETFLQQQAESSRSLARAVAWFDERCPGLLEDAG